MPVQRSLAFIRESLTQKAMWPSSTTATPASYMHGTSVGPGPQSGGCLYTAPQLPFSEDQRGQRSDFPSVSLSNLRS